VKLDWSLVKDNVVEVTATRVEGQGIIVEVPRLERPSVSASKY
jgi:hypothetical protein